MSWHYLPALVGESSEHTCSDGEPSAPWKRSRTVERCSFVGRETVCFLCSQSGTTAIPSTEDPGVTAWISSLPDSHASPSAPQERKSIHSTRGTAGQQPFAFLEKCSQGISYWKTSQGCFLDLTGISDRYSETWPRSGMMRSGTAFPLRPSVPRTSEIGSGCLPTPTAVSYGYNQGGAMGRTGPKRYSLDMMARKNLWPTPLASDGKKDPTKSLARVIQTGHQRGRRDGTTREGQQITGAPENRGGVLNPPWVAWLMGWPIDWTDLKPLEMDRWHHWCESFGMNCEGRQG